MERRKILQRSLSLLGVVLTSRLDIYSGVLQAMAQDQKSAEVDWPTEKAQIEKLIQQESARPGALIAFKDPCKEQYNKKEFMDKFDGC